MIPELLMRPRRIFAEVDGLVELRRRIRSRRIGAGHGVAEIREFADIAWAAEGTWDAHGWVPVSRSMQIGLGALAFFVNQVAGPETVEAIGCGERMRLVARQQVSETPARGRRCLEAAVAPAGVEIEALDRRPVDDRGAVHRHVDETAPRAEHAHAPDCRHQRHAAFTDVLDSRQVAALGVGIVAVDVAAEHQAALVGLADIEMPRPEGDDARNERLDRFRHEGLQHMALDRQPQTGACGDPRTAAGHRQANLARADDSPRGLDPDDAIAIANEAGDLAILDDVDAAVAGATCVAPDHGIVPRRAAALLQQAALDRKPRVVEIEKLQHATDGVRIQQLGIGAGKPHGVAAPGERVALGVRMIQVQHAALADHGVVVEVLLQALPQLHRPFVERLVARQQVVGSDDRGVAAGIAGSDPSLFEHRDVPHAVLPGEIVRSGEAMPTTADDDDVVLRARCGVAPNRLPVAMSAERLTNQVEKGITHAPCRLWPNLRNPACAATG